jgi:transposase InsO family protein
MGSTAGTALEGDVPWRNPMDERMEFMARLRSGERLGELCAEFGISRKTGRKFKKRFEALGIDGLKDQSRRPKYAPHSTDDAVVQLLVEARKAHPCWGPHKIKDVLEREHQTKLPAPSTIGGILKRAGLVDGRKRRRRALTRLNGLTQAQAANDVWCVDYKGQFRLGSGNYCYPLTITDQFSRLIIACEGMDRIDTDAAVEVFLDAFGRLGLPSFIRSDNGAPFASTGLLGLSRLSVVWLRAGIRCERIEPGCPEQNGRHERMHRTLKAETTRPAAPNLLQQQERFDAFVDEFNHRRPHQALENRRPAEVYQSSARSFVGLPELAYPTHDDALRVDSQGHIHLLKANYFLTKALARQSVGVREEQDGRWLVSFASLDLGYIDVQSRSFLPVDALPSPEL